MGKRRLLRPLSPLYGAVTGIRNRLYDRGTLAVTRVTRPVVSVGNLAVGGTGKTPISRWLARRLLAGGQRPAILLRGYGARGATEPVPPWRERVDPDQLDRYGDEALAHARAVEEALVYAHPDRVASAERAIAAGASVLILDDGFQHRRLGRDLDIVCLDWRRPLDPHGLLPAGDLREDAAGLGRADLVFWTRWDPGPVPGDGTRDGMGTLPPSIRWRFGPGALRRAGGSGSISPGKVLVVAGIVSPGSFEETARAAGLEVAGAIGFPDHYRYRDRDVRRVTEALASSGAAVVLTTDKDEARFLAVREGAALARDGRMAVLELACEPVGEMTRLREAMERLGLGDGGVGANG